MGLKRDCVYFSPMHPEQYRGWCDKLDKQIRAKNCSDCGWYRLKIHAGTPGEVVSGELERRLKDGKN